MKNPIWKYGDVALIIIDCQPEMYDKAETIDTTVVELNVRALLK